MSKGGRTAGIAVFALGIVILLFVFALAYGMFTSSPDEVFSSGKSGEATAAGLGSALALVLIKVALLFVMAIAGSLIASRGIQLYLGSGEKLAGPRDERSDKAQDV
jgi:uncharacterized membrane protein